MAGFGGRVASVSWAEAGWRARQPSACDGPYTSLRSFLLISTVGRERVLEEFT